ncbi:hypothetical protein DSECCO2_310590 [anaerobic digester metagenome]
MQLHGLARDFLEAREVVGKQGAQFFPGALQGGVAFVFEVAEVGEFEGLNDVRAAGEQGGLLQALGCERLDGGVDLARFLLGDGAQELPLEIGELAADEQCSAKSEADHRHEKRKHEFCPEFHTVLRKANSTPAQRCTGISAAHTMGVPRYQLVSGNKIVSDK